MVPFIFFVWFDKIGRLIRPCGPGARKAPVIRDDSIYGKSFDQGFDTFQVTFRLLRRTVGVSFASSSFQIVQGRSAGELERRRLVFGWTKATLISASSVPPERKMELLRHICQVLAEAKPVELQIEGSLAIGSKGLLFPVRWKGAPLTTAENSARYTYLRDRTDWIETGSQGSGRESRADDI
jgi:hypothetical protein